MGCASTASGCMSAPPRRWPRPKRPCWSARPESYVSGRAAVYGCAMPNPARVFTIPASTPFLPTLIKALLDGRLVDGFAPGADPPALATATLYLPTRRAARLARDVFLDVLGSEAAILPRIVAIGDVDEDEIAFDEAARQDFSGAALDVPEALGGLERRLLLASLVMQWASALTPAKKKDDAPLIASNPAAALALADD